MILSNIRLSAKTSSGASLASDADISQEADSSHRGGHASDNKPATFTMALIYAGEDDIASAVALEKGAQSRAVAVERYTLGQADESIAQLSRHNALIFTDACLASAQKAHLARFIDQCVLQINEDKWREAIGGLYTPHTLCRKSMAARITIAQFFKRFNMITVDTEYPAHAEPGAGLAAIPTSTVSQAGSLDTGSVNAQPDSRPLATTSTPAPLPSAAYLFGQHVAELIKYWRSQFTT